MAAIAFIMERPQIATIITIVVIDFAVGINTRRKDAWRIGFDAA